MRIYKITSPNTDLVYVGKTVQTLNQRMSNHKWKAKNIKNCSSIKVLECGDAIIELIEETDDNTREKYWIEELNTCNIIRYNSNPQIADKKHREKNRDSRNAKKREYYELNKMALRAKGREYYELNRDVITDKRQKKRNAIN